MYLTPLKLLLDSAARAARLVLTGPPGQTLF
jgi:hypothetical protein